MSRTADLIMRGFYVLAGVGLIAYSFTESKGRLWGLIIFGALLIIQGFSGA
jgi:hypothetical protein